MTRARSAYGDRAVYVSVDDDPAKLREMLEHSGGVRQVPVIVEAGKVTIGFSGSGTLQQVLPLAGGS